MDLLRQQEDETSGRGCGVSPGGFGTEIPPPPRGPQRYPARQAHALLAATMKYVDEILCLKMHKNRIIKGTRQTFFVPLVRHAAKKHSLD